MWTNNNLVCKNTSVSSIRYPPRVICNNLSYRYLQSSYPYGRHHRNIEQCHNIFCCLRKGRYNLSRNERILVLIVFHETIISAAKGESCNKSLFAISVRNQIRKNVVTSRLYRIVSGRRIKYLLKKNIP